MTQNNVLVKKGEAASKKLIENLKSRKFDAFYASNAKEALEKAMSLIPKGSVVAWGGSTTLDQIGIKERLYKDGISVIDRDKAATPQERVELSRKGLLSDIYLASVNAISEEGILINIDGFGNRVAAITFGPKEVILIVSANKICKTTEEALLRARNHASPLNALRLSTNTPCVQTGFCENCKSDASICSYIVYTRMCKVPGRIKIIIVGEDLGY
ncbi:MAG: lactate utilization protein [Elusimicrobiota bacterium]|jgi:L-lactate utilization protein LutB|nr:lactate utilization protein [Elusimicrobiota bacterium]